MRLHLVIALLLAGLGLGLLPSQAADERKPAGLFDVHDTCALCHDETWRGTAMQDEAGRNVAPVDLWSDSAMAHAAEDPLWRAVVAIEAAATPTRAADIEALCMRCHAPMAPSPGRFADFADDGEDGERANDGVSCTVCHGIHPKGLGTEASFSGGWTVGRDGRLFGPHEDPFDRPMRNHTDFVPTASDHVLESALCGTCHTLMTRALKPDGTEADGTLPEQTPYLEWRNSVYSTEVETPGSDAASCQDCHAPKTDLDDVTIRTRIAHNPGGRDFPPTRARQPYGRHVFAGANTLLPRLLGEEGAPAVEAQLRSAARLSLDRMEGGGTTLDLDLVVENRTGHKLPTAHPTRRVWLVLEVTDGKGKTVFASGGFDTKGRILGPDGKPLPSETAGGPLPTHTAVVTAPDQVALYDARMEDAEGKPTWLLTRGARFAKDDRLLPRGWRADGPHVDQTAPVGVEGDSDFGAGRDVVRYRVPIQDWSAGPFVVHARLVHQPLGARYAAELVRLDLDPARALRTLLAKVDLRPTVITEMEIRIDPPR